MKKTLLFAFAIALSAGLFFASCSKDDDSGDPQVPQLPAASDVVINGITWSHKNVDAVNTFAGKPDMYTKFYQWNRTVGYSATGSVSPAWTTTSITDASWTVNPCPAGWRLPTKDEFVALDAKGSTWAAANARGNAVAGRFYGPKHATCSLPSNMSGCVFFPAVGDRYYSGGALGYQASGGYYWSSTQSDSTYGYDLYFYSSDSNPAGSRNKANGFSVRCVQ